MCRAFFVISMALLAVTSAFADEFDCSVRLGNINGYETLERFGLSGLHPWGQSVFVVRTSEEDISSGCRISRDSEVVCELRKCPKGESPDSMNCRLLQRASAKQQTPSLELTSLLDAYGIETDKHVIASCVKNTAVR